LGYQLQLIAEEDFSAFIHCESFKSYLIATCLTWLLHLQNTLKNNICDPILWSEDVKMSEVYGRMTLQYGDKCVNQRNDSNESDQVLLVMHILGGN
jgi:hypothetical protein